MALSAFRDAGSAKDQISSTAHTTPNVRSRTSETVRLFHEFNLRWVGELDLRFAVIVDEVARDNYFLAF